MHRIYPHPNIYFELGAAFFDLILLVYLCIIKGEEVRHKRFRYFVLSVLVADVLDVLSVYSLVLKDKIPVFLILLVNEISYLFAAAMEMCFAYYIDSYTKPENLRKGLRQRINAGIMLVMTALLIVNTFTQAIIYIPADREGIIRKPLFYGTIAVIIVYYFLYATITILMHFHKLSRKQRAVFGVLLFMAFIGMFSQLYVGNRSPIAMLLVSFGMYGIFFSFESPDYRALMTVLEELDSAENNAEEASRTKSMFLANMSHEIRTPLNAILGMNELIIGSAREPDVLAYAQGMQNSGQDLMRVVNEILDYSRLDAGDVSPIYGPFSLSSMTGRLFREFHHHTEQKHLAFYGNVDQNLPDRIYGDQENITRILTNILDNAVTYTTSGSITFGVRGSTEAEIDDLKRKKHANMIRLVYEDGSTDLHQLGPEIEEHIEFEPQTEVDEAIGGGLRFFQKKAKRERLNTDHAENAKAALDVARRANMTHMYLTFEVSDTGPGMEMKDIPMMFDSFRRIAVRGIGAVSGTGLGLTIANSLANLLGGLISVQSKDGRGSTFLLVLPIEVVGKTSVGEVNAYRRTHTEAVAASAEQGQKSEAATQTAGGCNRVTGQKGMEMVDCRVLVLDDNPMNLKVAAGLLKGIVSQYNTVSNGEDALRMLEQGSYDLVITDHKMPGMSGEEFLREARKLFLNPNPRIVLMTASTPEEARKVAEREGFDGYLPKPVRKEELYREAVRSYERNHT